MTGHQARSLRRRSSARARAPRVDPAVSTYLAEPDMTLLHGQASAALATLEAGSVQCVVTSPPYFGLRDYGVAGQLGLEASPAAYVERLVAIMRAVRRVLADDGVLWLNLGDSYAAKTRGSDLGWDKSRLDNPGYAQKAQSAALRRTGERHRGQRLGIGEKNLLGMPWRVAFALQDDGWILRNDVIWNKPNAMPESVTDRLSTRYEHLFLLSKSRRYWFDLAPIREPLLRPEAADGTRVFGGAHKGGHAGVDATQRRRGGNTYTAAPSGGRNPGDVWTITTQPFPGAHFATMPREIVRRCVLAGCPEGRVVLDPFVGSGTTLMVARRLGRRGVGIDLNADYLAMATKRIGAPTLLFDAEEAS